MKNKILIFLLCLTGFISCSKQVNNQDIALASSLVETDTNKSFDILNSIDVNNLSQNDEAKYRLVLSRIYERKSIVLKNDSIIAPAVEYFKQSGDNENLAQALFLLAKVQSNNSDIKSATENLLKTLDLLDPLTSDSTQLRLYAATCHDIASIYFEQDYFEEAEVYFTKSSKALEKIDPNISIDSWFMVAMVKVSNGERDKGIEILKNLQRDTKDEELRTWLDMVIINATVNSKIDIFSPQELLEMLEQIEYSSVEKLSNSSNEREWSESPIFIYNTISALVYFRNKMPVQSFEYIKKAMSLISPTSPLNVGFYKFAAEVARIIGKNDEAFNYLNLYQLKSDSLNLAMREHQVRQVEANYKRRNADEIKMTHLSYRLYISIAVATVLLIAIVLAVKSYKSRIKRQKSEIEEYIATIDNYKETENKFTQQLRENDARESVIKNYLSSRKDMAQQIAATYYTYGETKLFAEKMRDLALSKEMLCDIVRMTDIYSDGALAKLKNTHDNWTEKNYNFAALLIAGFSPQEISVMLGMTLGGVYTLKSKLKRKILDDPKEQKEEFLAYFS